MMPAGSQSPHAMRTWRVLVKAVTSMVSSQMCVSGRPRESGDPAWIPACAGMSGASGNANSSPRRHAERAVEADHFAVEIAIVDAMHDQRGELARLAEALGERHRGAERILRLLRQSLQHRRAEDAGCDGQHADAELRKFARRWNRQRGDAAFGG